jgi:hypothetical protein
MPHNQSDRRSDHDASHGQWRFEHDAFQMQLAKEACIAMEQTVSIQYGSRMPLTENLHDLRQTYARCLH